MSLVAPSSYVMKRAVVEKELELIILGTRVESHWSPTERGQLWASSHMFGVMKE